MHRRRGIVANLSWGGEASLPPVYAAQPSADEQRPLKWSHMPITFHAEDHLDRTTGVGVLPLVVSPVIHNVTVTKMLVDGGAGLNLISADLLGKLQIPREQLAIGRAHV